MFTKKNETTEQSIHAYISCSCNCGCSCGSNISLYDNYKGASAGNRHETYDMSR